MRAILLALTFLAQAAPQPQRPVIRSTVDLVTTDLQVRDEHGQFVSDLGKDDFEVYEDAVKQNVSMFVLTHGGRVYNETPAQPRVAPEGLLLPPARPPGDKSGRVFLIFVDDFHFNARLTPRVRDLLKRIETDLIHDGDLFGVVSSGYSSIAIDMTYDRKRLTEAIRKVQGAGLPDEVIATPEGSQGPAEVRHRAHVAFATAYEILGKFEQIHDRRKAFIYISEGYDFDPYARSRAKPAADRNPAPANSSTDTGQVPVTNPFSNTSNEFAAADLAAELTELTREANRANTTIYTIDPRGLVDGPDIDQTTLDSTDWQDHVRETQNSLRSIAELTGGIAVVNQNDFEKALKRIDGETSDYYVVGYYSSNPDPMKKRRTIEIRVKSSPKRHADRYQLSYRTSYTLKPY
ncbi:MAG TPA: VWA domain-containing protein [Vicinamibacterales bacterium]|nr:VWA domain-containing protein [Vicinamibacterales bacterium]